MKRIKFLIYTILFGLIPLAVRFILYKTIRGVDDGYFFNVIDVVTLGLMILTGTFSELDEQTEIGRIFKFTIKGLLIVAIINQSCCLGISYFSELLPKSDINIDSLKEYSLLTAGFSLLLSVALFVHPDFKEDEI